MVPTVVSAAMSRGRKRQRRQLTPAAADRPDSVPLSARLPRVGTAPANLGASPARDAAVIRKRAETRAKNRRPPSPEFVDSSDLDAQISTLALIRANGYGPVPGTPLLRRGATASSPSSAGGPRNRAAAYRARDVATAVGSAAAVHAGKVQRQSRSRGGGDSARTNRDPWMGPLDAWDVAVPTALEPNTIERQELKRTKAHRLASVRGRCLLSQNRVLNRRDLFTTAQLLASARAEFLSADDANGASEVDETFIKIKADIVMETIQAARKSRDYGRLQQLMFEALHYFAVLACHGQVNRHDTLGVSERREANKRTYERLRHPLRLCREYALEDGRKSRAAAAASTRKRMYAEARSQLEDARLCFNWAGNSVEEMRELDIVEGELKVRENTTCGDRLTEGVASKLQFLTPKDYSGLFSKLSEAATAYVVAKDHDGTKVVRIVKAALNAVLSAERRWMQAADALKERRYSSAAELLKDSKLFIADATKGLPYVSPSLARASKILNPPGGVPPLDIVAELAALDGLKDHAKSIRALEQGMLDKAQQLNTSAREVFEFIDLCSTTSNRSQRGSVDSSVGKSKDEERNSSDTARGNRSGSFSPTRGDSAAGVAEGAFSLAPGSSLSDDELKEGEALLLKICRSTSAPANPDDRIVKPRASSMIHPGVRHRVEDLLDEISETEDIITRKKALERGDSLMATFWAAVAKSTAIGGTAGGGAPGETAGAATINTESNHKDGVSTIVANGPSPKSSAGADVNQHRWDAQQVPGPGGALSPEMASRCLQLLVDARDAYEGQGFCQQADGAGRLRAALLADRCLAQAQALSRSARAIATTTSVAIPATGGDNADAEVAGSEEPWLTQWAQSGRVLGGCSHGQGGGGLEAAKEAAQEAKENYSRADNAAGAQVARRMGMSLSGDEAMLSITPLLEKRAYDAVVDGLDQARRLYTDAGQQGLEGLYRTRDPLGLVKAVAMRDGKQLKGEAVRVLRDGDVEASRKLCEQAQDCFFFVDREGLADATADVYAAIHMVTRLSSGDALVVAAETAFEGGESDKAAELLNEAKSFFHHAQLSYEDLVNQVTTLLEEHPNDLEVARKATELQDNINKIYDSRRDGHRAVKVELCLDCLAADASLHNLAQVVDNEQFEDARTLLSAAALVYERSMDEARLSKVGEISSLVGLLENASRAFEEGRYADAEGLVAEGLVTRAALDAKQPLCLRPPDCALFRGGKDGAKTAVLLRVRAAGEANRTSALQSLETGDFEAAERAAFSACKRFEWWAGHHPNTTGGGDGEARGEGCIERERRQAVIRSAKELMASVASAASKARAERLKHEGRELKSMGKFVAAVRSLKSAAELFHTAGLGQVAIETRVEASRTQAEALLLTSAELHSEGKFEAIAAHLERAESLLLEAAAELAGSPSTANAVTTAAFASGGAAICRYIGDEITVDGEAVKLNDSKRSFGGTCGGENDPSSEQVDGDGGAGARCRILQDLVNLRSRAAGDMVMGGVAPALDARDYDKGLLLMLEADRHYTAVKTGRWMISVAAAFRKDSSFSSMSSPKELVMKRAAQDGDRLRGEAASAIQKEKNPVKARELLSGAETCMAWAGVDPFAAGAVAVSKDIKIFESRAKGDGICKGLIGRLQNKDFKSAKGMLEEALTNYRQGDAFKQIADTQAVAFCVERESEMCSDVIAALVASDPAAALKTLEDAHPVFQIAAELGSAVLREVAELIGVKHRQMTILSTFCRAWVQCDAGTIPASGDEGDVPDSVAVLEGALSDLRALIASEASVLDVPLDLLQDARERVSAKVVTSPTIPLAEAVDIERADAGVAASEDGEIPLSVSRNAGYVPTVKGLSDQFDGEARIGAATTDGANERRSGSDGDAQPATPARGRLDGKRVSRDVDGLVESEDKNVLGDDDFIDAARPNDGSGSALPQGTAGSGLHEENLHKPGPAYEEARDANSDQGTARQDEDREASNAEKTNVAGTAIENTSMMPVDQADGGYRSGVDPAPSSSSLVTSAELLPSDGVSSSALGSLECSDPLPLSSSTKDGRPMLAHEGKGQNTSEDDSAEPQHLGLDLEAAGGDNGGGGNGSPENTVEDASASTADTAHAARHSNEASKDVTGEHVASIAFDNAKEERESIASGRKSSASISTTSSVEPASVNSVGPEATADGSQGRGHAVNMDPLPDAGTEDDGVIRGGRLQDYAVHTTPTERNTLAVDDSKMSTSLPSSDVDQEGGLATTEPTNHGMSVQCHLDEETEVDAAPNDDDTDISYDLDSDFGDYSGDIDSPAESPFRISSGTVGPTKTDITETACIGEGDNDSGLCDGPKEDGIGAPPPSEGPRSRGFDVEREEEHAAADDESDYPSDIDNVEGEDSKDDNSLSSDSTVGVSDNSNSVSLDEGKYSSSPSSTSSSKSARGSSSGSSGGRLSKSHSAEDGESVHNESTASAPTQARAKTIRDSPSSGGNNTDASDQDDDNDSGGYSVSTSTAESANTMHSKRHSSTATDQNAEDFEQPDQSTSFEDSKITATHDDGSVSALPPDSIDPDTMGSPSRFVEGAEKGDRHEDSPFHILEDDTGNALKAFAEVAVARGTAMKHKDNPTGSETVELEAAKMDEIYNPNLDEIETSVDVGDLKRQFGAMLSSSFSQPREEPHAAGSERFSAPPRDPAHFDSPGESEGLADSYLHVPNRKMPGADEHVSDENGRKDEDGLYSSFGDDGWNNQNGAFSSHSNVHELGGAHEGKDDGHHYTQEEWDHYNEAHGDHDVGAETKTAESDVGQEGVAGSTRPHHSHNEASSGTWAASEAVPTDGAQRHEPYQKGGGVGEVAGVQSSSVPSSRANDDGDGNASVDGPNSDTIEKALHHQEEELVSSSSAEQEDAVTEKESGDDIDSAAVGQWKDPPKAEAEEPEDLFDIEGLGMSSSDSD